MRWSTAVTSRLHVAVQLSVVVVVESALRCSIPQQQSSVGLSRHAASFRHEHGAEWRQRVDVQGLAEIHVDVVEVGAAQTNREEVGRGWIRKVVEDDDHCALWLFVVVQGQARRRGGCVHWSFGRFVVGVSASAQEAQVGAVHRTANAAVQCCRALHLEEVHNGEHQT